MPSLPFTVAKRKRCKNVLLTHDLKAHLGLENYIFKSKWKERMKQSERLHWKRKNGKWLRH